LGQATQIADKTNIGLVKVKNGSQNTPITIHGFDVFSSDKFIKDIEVLNYNNFRTSFSESSNNIASVSGRLTIEPTISLQPGEQLEFNFYIPDNKLPLIEKLI